MEHILIDTDTIVSDLQDLAVILNSISEVCEDVQPLYDAAQLCNQNRSANEYSYSLSRLFFKLIYVPGHIIPVEGAKDLRIELRIDIGGYFPKENIISDPIANLQVNILLFGSKKHEDLFSSWHQDYHNYTGSTDNVHPKYHFTFGGTEMYQERSTLDYGQTLILTSPRLSHPPLDAILAVDFILNHYFDRELLDDVFANSRYKEIIRKAQYRLWKPYALALAANWKTHDDIEYDSNMVPNMIFPDLQ